MATDALHFGDYHVEHYEALTSEGYGPRFSKALFAADAATLVRAFHYVIEEGYGDPARSIGHHLCTRHGFTDEDLQLLAEMKNPASPAARQALGLPPAFLCPDPKASHGEAQVHATSSAMESTTTPTSAAITLRDPKSLALHPCLDGMPELASDDAKFQALVADVRDRGFDYPAIIDEQDRVIDGRHRRRIALLLGVELPTVRRAGAEASEIILSTLLQRRHYPKGALAYMAAPLFTEVAESGRARRLEKLKAGSNPREFTQYTHGGAVGKTIDQLAEELGFSKELYHQARKVREFFEDTAEYDWPGLDRPTTRRRYFEPQILDGEIGLGGVIQALAGKIATEGKEKPVRPALDLFKRAVGDLKTRFDRHWEKLAPEERRPVVQEIAKEATAWPEDVRRAVLQSLKQSVNSGSEPTY